MDFKYMDIKPSLIEINNLIKMRNSAINVGNETLKKIKIDGFLSFIYDIDTDKFSQIFVLIFFLLLILFLYYKYKNKETKEFNKDKSIIQFISSVDNHLNYNKTSI